MRQTTIILDHVTKRYKLYENPIDRVKEVFSLSKKSYGTEICVLKNISITMDQGDIIGIIGTNGAGKSTLLKLITGVLTPTSGHLQVYGKIAALLELGTGFNPELTGIKNIYLNGTMMGFSHDEMEQKLQNIIEFADIGDFINQPVKTYSSGMFARLAFAVAINVEPDILIVDEALSVGDIRFQMKCMDKIKSMMDSRVTTILVSHDINMIRRFCTKCIWLKNGKVQIYGKTNEVCDKYMDFLKMMDVPSMRKEPEMQLKQRAGDIVAEIVNIRLTDETGRENQVFQIFQKMTVEVFYDVYDTEIEHPVLGIALKRMDDEYICGVNTLLDGTEIPWNYGRNYLKLIYQDGIRVLGGGYYFDVAIFDKTATVPIQYLAKAKEFTVTAEYIGEGVFIVPHEWRR